MFEHYVQVQGGNPKWRRAVEVSAILSGIFTGSILTSMWFYEKLSIERVDPPTNATVVVQMMEESMAPGAPPPALAKLGGGEEVEEEEIEEEEEEEPIPTEDVPIEQPDDVKELPDKPKHAKSEKSLTKGIPGAPPGPGVPNGSPLGVVGGTRIGGPPGGVIGGLGTGFGNSVATKKQTPPPTTMKPFTAVRANGVYTPDPNAAQLAKTKAARFDKRPGVSKVSFCITPSGKTTKVKTVQKFRGDPEVDQICRDTVKKWRFKPFKVGGKAVETCTTYRFDIVFR